MRVNKTIITTISISLAIIISGAGIFYWFGYRPSDIKKTCSENSINQYENDIQTIGDKWNDKIFQDTGYSWDEIFNCREKDTPLFLAEDKKTDEQKRCEQVLYGNKDEYWTWYPVHVAGRYDVSRNDEITAAKKKRDEAVDRYYKECLRSKGI